MTINDSKPNPKLNSQSQKTNTSKLQPIKESLQTTTPNPSINISSQNVYGNCDLKCSYNYQYNQSNSVATNNGLFLSLSYDKGTTSPVIYNTHNYYVSKINIYSPSLHSFEGKTVNAEFVIEHTPEIGGDLLYVCIPIIASTNSTDASSVLSEIIQAVANNAPAMNESTNLNLSNFNLNTIVPKKPFFSYTGTKGLMGQVIVFANNNAIPLNDTILKKLSNIVKPYPITIDGGNLFFNSKGPNTTQVSKEGIYISCQPTGSSKEEIDVSYSKNNIDYNLSSILNNPTVVLILQTLVGCILFILVFYILNYGYNYFTSGSTASLKLPKLPTFVSFKKNI
jgi:carbonic anhydrase